MHVCRDEFCDRLDLHQAHASLEIAFEPPDTSTSVHAPWRRPAPKALDHSIAKAVSKTYPKPFGVLLRDVQYDYGACNLRTVHRRLRRLVDRGYVLRIALGRRLYAYVRPGSNMVNDIDLMREQIIDLMREQQIEMAAS